MREIQINGTYSFSDLGALLANVDETYPEINDVIGTVPYSGVEHNFTSLYGKRVYSYRDVTYTFKLWDNNHEILESMIARFVNFMYGLGDDLDIYDTESNYHYVGRLTEFKKVGTTGEEYGARKFACTFRCKTCRENNVDDSIPKTAGLWPDVNDDGAVNATDAANILIAAANIGAGQPSGLSPEMEKRADANQDGKINATDAAFVTEFSAAVGGGKYENTVDGWYEFLNDKLGHKKDVI